jgi:uncharacterized protein (DUF58 family)
MTKAWFLITVLFAILFCAGLVFVNAALMALALPYLLFVLLPFRCDPLPVNLQVQRRLEPDYLDENTACRVTVAVTNDGPSLENVHLKDLLPAGLRTEGRPEYHGMLLAGQSRALQYDIRAGRGKYHFPGLSITHGDLLGMWQEEKFFPTNQGLTVLPAFERLEKIKIFPYRTRAGAGIVRSRNSGTGVEFFGTRAYVQGDPLRCLNWKAGARWDLLVTNLFEQERAADISLILDARNILEIRHGAESLFEHSVAAASSLADYFIGKGNRVGFLAYGRVLEWVLPGYGKQQRARIMDSLAQAELGEHVAFKELRNLPIRLFPSESQLVFISPLRSQDVFLLRYVRALGYQVLIVSPDPVAFEKSTLPRNECAQLAERIVRLERDNALSKLRRSGVRVVEWDVTRPLWISIKSALTGDRR